MGVGIALIKKTKFKLKLEESLKLPIDRLNPNEWNPNVLPKEKYAKLKKWIRKCREETGKVPLPVVVRPISSSRFEIIDGEHRWRATKELGYTDIDCHIYECDTKTAKLLTNSLNYLKGEPDKVKEASYVQDLINEGLSLEEIVQHTDYTEDRLDDMVLTAGIEIEDVDMDDAKEEESEKKLESWIDLKFTVPVEVAEIIEAEIARIGTVLTGKNIRGRCLEFMAVNSANTPLPTDTEMKKKVYASALGKKLSLRKKKK